MSVILFLFCIEIHLYDFLDSTCNWHRMKLSLSGLLHLLTDFTFRFISVIANGNISLFFMVE